MKKSLLALLIIAASSSAMADTYIPGVYEPKTSEFKLSPGAVGGHFELKSAEFRDLTPEEIESFKKKT